MSTARQQPAQSPRKIPLTVYVTEMELNHIDRMAEEAERSRSDWTRRTLLAAIADKKEE